MQQHQPQEASVPHQGLRKLEKRCRVSLDPHEPQDQANHNVSKMLSLKVWPSVPDQAHLLKLQSRASLVAQ